MKKKFAKFLAFVFLIIMTDNSAIAAPKIPTLELTNSFLISKASEISAFLRAQDNWVIEIGRAHV